MKDKTQALREICQAIEATGVLTEAGAEYDLGAILSETYTFHAPGGYAQTATVEEFWESVERNAKG